jgi:hypothetical protein
VIADKCVQILTIYCTLPPVARLALLAEMRSLHQGCIGRQIAWRP